MLIPQSYTISKFFTYAGNAVQNRNYLCGSCPICHEGSSWLKKKRLFYFLYDDYLFCHNCFSGDTKILTLEYGPIEFYKIQNQFVTIKCKDGIWRLRKIINHGKQDLYKYEFSNVGGKKSNIITTIYATENHKWFIKYNKKRRKQHITTSLKINDILESTSCIAEPNLNGLIHGIIFGDGTYRKYKGQKRYAILRVCKQDSRKEEILSILRNAGYIPTYPPNLKGDAYINIGNVAGLKDIPNTLDPSYISGFIKGLWLTDGYKSKKWSISTTRLDVVNWLIKFSGMAGFRVANIPSATIRKNCYPNAKPIYTINLQDNSNIVLRKKTFDRTDDVFCLEEPVTGGFFLANGILTGNCGRGWNPYFFIREVSGMSFKQIKQDIIDYTGDDDFVIDFSFTEKSVIEMDPLPGECVNLNDPNQVNFYRKNLIVELALKCCRERRLFTALNAPKTFYASITDRYHKDRLLIPHFNGNKIESYITRSLLTNDTRAKYLLKFNAEKPVFNIDKIDVNYPYIFLFEGWIDSMFVKNGVGISGTYLTEHQENLLTSQFPFHKLIWVFDNYKIEGDTVRKIITDKLKEDESVFVYENEISSFKDLNQFCVEKKQDQIDPAFLLDSVYTGKKGLLKL